MTQIESDSLLAAAYKREHLESGLAVSARALQEKRNNVPLVWPEWFKEDGQFLSETGALDALRRARNRLLVEYKDARIIVSPTDELGMESTPRLFLIWGNQERPRKWSVHWMFNAVGVYPKKDENGKRLGVVFDGSRGYVATLGESELTGESFDASIVKAANGSGLISGYPPTSPFRFVKQRKIAAATIR